MGPSRRDGADMYALSAKLGTTRLPAWIRTAAWSAVAISVRCRLVGRGVRRTSPAEYQAAGALAGPAGLQPHLPDSLPTGYVLTAASAFKSGGGVEFVFRSPDGERSFRLTQRAWFVPLTEEIQLAKVPHTRVRGVRNDLFVLPGEFYEEPIDHGFWHQTRWATAWQRGPLVSQFRCVRGRAPSAATLIRCSLDVREPPFTSYRPPMERDEL
ncbi:hypothetical protein GCM10023114_47850 [Mycolicibacterium sediminis]|uniref:Uncharacterized protein n=2 Tax=Mycolicibacterium sediminis TaxID=1286180 RepID=A0A7I7QMF0_9MYCO|nr:hypothetical protein MSEDJ_15580 [Mycolicibacterium sediminis]